MSDPRQVVVVAPNWLGDAVMALPAIADVKRHFGRVTVAARPAVASLFRLSPAVDTTVALTEDARTLAALQADVAILLPNSFASAWQVKRAGIAGRWGYARDLRGWLLTRAVRPPRGGMHQGEYYQQLTAALGIPAGPLQPSLEVPAPALANARELLASRGWDRLRPLVVMAPGAAYGTAKRWLPAHFAELVASVVREANAFCVLVGSAGDAETTRWVVESLAPDVSASVADLTGATTLEALAGVLRLARTCVSNDSGAMHLAAALGVPVAALFGPTRDRETAPLAAAGGRTALLINPVWCRPCMLRECPIDHRCMKGLAPARVFSAVRELMA